MGNNPSEALEEFLSYISGCEKTYRSAFEAVGKEDTRLQDLLHGLEFAPDDDAAILAAAKKLRESRKHRRENKDIVLMLEKTVKHYGAPRHRKELSNLRDLLEQQRKTEEYLQGERTYIPRADG